MAILEDWLDELASAAPAPGGGAAAALNGAIGAALISMVCNLTIGKPQFAEAAAELTAVLARATDLRRESLELAAEDAVAFEGVMAAYRHPKATDEEKANRTEAIQRALVAAADVPLRAGTLAAEVIGLADRIEGPANPNVLSDVAVAASSARAALEAAIVNVEVNAGAITDAQRKADLVKRVDALAPLLAVAEDVVARVRQRLS